MIERATVPRSLDDTERTLFAAYRSGSLPRHPAAVLRDWAAARRERASRTTDTGTKATLLSEAVELEARADRIERPE